MFIRTVIEKPILILLLAASLKSVGLEAQGVDQEFDQARALTKTFGDELKATLVSAIQADGLVHAIAVCHREALPIASNVSGSLGWELRRTSLKLRNQANAPDAWEKATLMQFEQRKAAGESIAGMEQTKHVVHNGDTVYRYMRAIPAKGVCLSCHGNNLDASVLTRLQLLYPDDTATGFNLGDIRGAFSLQKTVRESKK